MTTPDDTEELTSQRGAAVRGVRLVVTAGATPDLGRETVLERGTAFIGRAAECELVLVDAKASRRHATLAVNATGVIVEDLGSRNGTSYLGSRIERAELPVGASIVIGDTTIAILPLTSSELDVESSATRYGELIGQSVAMRRVLAALRRLEASDVHVRLVGAPGTGKALIAQTIHGKSRRSERPFVAVRCRDADDADLRHELFGRVGRPGALEAADGGTLYLADVDTLTPKTQGLLLRALEEKRTRRMGEELPRRVNVRLVTSSLPDAALLRDELEHLLAVVRIDVPPLRERRDDIPLLAHAIVRAQGKGASLGEAELAHLMSQSWPGNLPELRSAILRILSVGLHHSARPTLIANEGTVESQEQSYKEARERLVTNFEAQYVRDLLKRHDGNVSAAAREAKISRKHLHELLRRHGISS